jgi:hypothetical protein
MNNLIQRKDAKMQGRDGAPSRIDADRFSVRFQNELKRAEARAPFVGGAPFDSLRLCTFASLR